MTQANPTYYDGDLRRDLLVAAAAAVAEHGAGAVSLREIARAVGVSHAAPAHHFGDKQGLFTALAAEGFVRLAAALAAGCDNGGDDAVERLIGMGAAYVRFAREEPAFFAVIFRADIVDITDADYARAGAEAYTVLAETVASAQEAGWGRGEDTWVLTAAAWSLVQGLATLASHGALQATSGFRSADDVGAEVGRAFTTAFGTRPGHDRS